MKNSSKKTKFVARVMLVVLLLASAVSFVGCEWINHFTTTTERGPLKTTKPAQDIVQNIPNTFETVETTLALENGEEITIIHGKDFNEDDIDFLLKLHGQRRNDSEIVDPPQGYSLKNIITAGKNGDPIFLAHFENPYIICAYTSEYEEEKFDDYNFDVTKYVWYKFYNAEQVVDKLGEMERTKDSYLFYDCLIKKDIVNGVEYNKEYKYYTEYLGEKVFERTTPDMILYFEFDVLNESKFILSPEHGGGVHEVYIDENGVEYLYFYYGSYYEDGTEYENYTQKRFGEHYEYLSQYFEILDEYVNDSGRTVKYAGIKLDNFIKYLNDER